jgi:signal peptidase II
VNGRVRLGLVALLLVFLADQGSKWWILNVADLPHRRVIPLLPVLDLTMVWNQGVTFGLLHAAGAFAPVLLAGVALLVVAALALWLRRAETLLVAGALGAIAGGALGNIVDRFRFGAVVDFIYVHAGALEIFPWVFNVGDSAIVCGVGALVLDGLLPRSGNGKGPLARAQG